MHTPETDAYWINRCLELAQQAEGQVSPNPLVGSVVLDAQGQLIGEGFHQAYGGPHAEVNALAMAVRQDAQARLSGGTLYVNLEPCNHTGKTPPCTQAILQSGIHRVVFGTLDANPLVAGQGANALQNAGLQVSFGIQENACLWLNRRFFYSIQRQTEANRCYVTVKLATTLDGRIADRYGNSQWITSTQARHKVQLLRRQHDAILTTADTVIQDKARLTVRDVPLLGPRKPTRVILDRQFRLNAGQHEILTPEIAPVIICIGDQATQDPNLTAKRMAFEQANIEVIPLPETESGLSLPAVFEALTQRQLFNILVEAGGKLATSLFEARLVQELHYYIAGKLLSDIHALPAFSGERERVLPQAHRLTLQTVTRLENDVLLVYTTG
jgi:diaminohydroxyphosphoribosylaminopyrimidine deaminase/5-amino-6-(5-phosphoribosylamino)uracil reductase